VPFNNIQGTTPTTHGRGTNGAKKATKLPHGL